MFRPTSQYCDLAKELVKASDYLENDQYMTPDERMIPDQRLSTTLADWLLYKAGVLDQHFQVWEIEEKRSPQSLVSLQGGARAMTEKQYSHALAVAREVNEKVEGTRGSETEGQEG
jgi:hypothetical protein